MPSGYRSHIEPGQRFGRLVVLSELPRYVRPSGAVDRMFLTLCDCGKEAKRALYAMASGRRADCGCSGKAASAEKTRQRFSTHGMSKRTRIYRIWCLMICRCHNKNTPSYKRYGALGIQVCDEWRNSFEAFYAYAGDAPDGMSIDRIDGSRGYEPGNVRWANAAVQNRNKRNAMTEETAMKVRSLLAQGHTPTEAAALTGVSRTAASKILNGVSWVAEARTIPIPRHPDVQAHLDQRADKAESRRFAAEPVPITGFGSLEPAQQVATLIRDMRDPTHEELQAMLGALATRVDDMDKSGRYVGMDVLGDRIDAAFLALDQVYALELGERA